MSSTSDLLLRIRADVSQAQRALSQLGGELNKLNQPAGAFGKTSGMLGTTGALIMGFGNLQTKVAAVMGASVHASEQFNDAFADVIRTVDDADKVGGFGALKTDLIDLSKRIPVTATELANIAAQGGQMNVHADELVAFTETVATLGKVTKLSTTDAAEGLGKLANISGDRDWKKLASIVVGLGQVNVGGEQQVLDMGQRLALVGTQMGLSVPQILSIGAAVSDTGIEAEMGGSAVSRVFLQMQMAASSASAGVVGKTREIRDAMQRVGDLQDDLGLATQARSELFTRRGKLKRGVQKSTLMSADLRISRLGREIGDQQSDLTDMQHPGQKALDAFSSISGIAPADFAGAFKADPFAVFRSFIGGLGEKKAAGEDIFSLLDGAGINNIRELQTIAGLAGTQGHLDELLGVANAQAANPTALDAGAQKKFGTDLAQQQIINNDVTAGLIAAGDKLAPQLIDAEKTGLQLLGDAQNLQGVLGAAPEWMGPFGGIMNAAAQNMDKIVIGAAALQTVMPFLGMLGGGGAAAGGVAAAGGGAAAVAGGGLLALAPPLAIGALIAAALVSSQNADLKGTEAAPGTPRGLTISTPVTVTTAPNMDVSGIVKQTLDAVGAALNRAFEASASSGQPQRQLGGDYSAIMNR